MKNHKFLKIIFCFLILFIISQLRYLTFNFFSQSQAKQLPEFSKEFKASHTFLEIVTEPQLLDSVKKKKGFKKAHKKRQTALEKVYCQLQKSVPDLILDKNTKIYFGSYADLNKIGLYAWVYSSSCPEDKYSIIEINSQGKVEVNINCEDATLEQLISHSSLQWEINPMEKYEYEYNFALNGKGNFLIWCLGDGFFLTRKGRFQYSSGFLQDENGCYLWGHSSANNGRGNVLWISNPEDTLNESGCFSHSKKCPHIVDFKDPHINNLEYINSTTAAIEINGFLENISSTKIFPNSLEDLESVQRGPTGILEWDFVPNIPWPINCKK